MSTARANHLSVALTPGSSVELSRERGIMKLCVAAIQLPATVESIDGRLREIEARMRLASAQGARLLVLPELSLTGYEFGPRAITRAEPVPGPIVTTLAELARTCDVIAVAGVMERSGSDCFDTLVVVGPDGYLGKYRKIHVAFTENAYWNRGECAGIVETDIGAIGLGICADMAYRTPWAWYRDRVDIVAVGSAWPDWRGKRFFPVSHGCRRTIAEAILSLPRKISRRLGFPSSTPTAVGRSPSTSYRSISRASYTEAAPTSRRYVTAG